MIRKISVGVDYKDAMHFTVGQTLRGSTIDTIRQVDANNYEIFIEKGGETFLWKKVINMPVVVEMNIDSF